MNKKGIGFVAISIICILLVFVLGIIVVKYFFASPPEKNISEKPELIEKIESSITFLSSGLCDTVSQTTSSTDSNQEYQCNNGRITPQILGIKSQITLNSQGNEQGILINNVTYFKKVFLIQGEKDEEVVMAFDCNKDRIFSDAVKLKLNQLFDFTMIKSFVKEKCSTNADILLKPSTTNSLVLTNIQLRDKANSKNVQFVLTNISFSVIPNTISLITKGDNSTLEFMIQRDKDSIELQVISLKIDMEDQEGQVIRVFVDMIKDKSASLAPQKISVPVPNNIVGRVVRFNISPTIAMPPDSYFDLYSPSKYTVP